MTPDAPDLCARIRGCLLGGAAGDALGAPVEFWSLAQIRARYGPAGIRDFDEAFGVVGAVTDDTQMTLFTAEGLLRALNRSRDKGICHVPSVVYHAYLRWLHTQGHTSEHALFRPDAFDGWLVTDARLFHQRAPGATCLAALKGRTMGTRETPTVNDSKGCGGVMRVAPVGLLATRGAFALGCETAATTHGHPSGFLAAGALAETVKYLLIGASPADALAAAEACLVAERDADECLAALINACHLAADGPATPERVETLGGGWVADEAFAIAAYALLAAERTLKDGAAPHAAFEQGVAVAVNHSGDSDSTGAMAGNLLGAWLGEGAIPHRWRAVEMRDLIEALADDVCDAAQGKRLSRDRYPGW